MTLGVTQGVIPKVSNPTPLNAEKKVMLAEKKKALPPLFI
jgi:hypothetical protein